MKKKWTRREEVILIQEYSRGIMTLREIGAKLNRSRKSVYNKAQQLGLCYSSASDIDKFLKRFNKKSEVFFHNSECWIWNGGISHQGYGIFYYCGKSILAHRFAYQYYIGSLDQDKEISHKCRHRNCVNPLHLQQITPVEHAKYDNFGNHNKIKTHCIHGHLYSKENTYFTSDGRRDCRTCINERSKKYYRSQHS